MSGAISETIILYALKCNGSYVKVEAGGCRLVAMDKASVFKDIPSLQAVIKEASVLGDLRLVELRLTEHEIGPVEEI